MSVEHGVPSAAGFIAVVGPPAVGKSTVTGALADRFGARVFRLREFAHEFCARSGVDQRLFNTGDPLGWLPEKTVALLIRAAFLHGQFPAQPMVVLENFPGSLTQLWLLNATVGQLGAPLVVVELTAGDGLLEIRVRTRRVCPTCEPDLRGDPHRPARSAAEYPDRCVSCGGVLALRRGDEPQRFATRLARFRRRIPAIRQAVRSLCLPYHVVDATGDPTSCLHRVTTALAATSPLAHLLASRCEHL
jgi:adenylate kinase family enzyme